MYSRDTSLLLPVVMHLLFLHGGSFAAPLVFDSNSTDVQAHTVLDINVSSPAAAQASDHASQNIFSGMLASHQAPSTLQSIIQTGARYIQPLVSYLQGLMGSIETVDAEATPQSRQSAGMIRHRLKGLRKVDLV
jgi:hypothetical protein